MSASWMKTPLVIKTGYSLSLSYLDFLILAWFLEKCGSAFLEDLGLIKHPEAIKSSAITPNLRAREVPAVIGLNHPLKLTAGSGDLQVVVVVEWLLLIPLGALFSEPELNFFRLSCCSPDLSFMLHNSLH
jgi:hypothetical protein